SHPYDPRFPNVPPPQLTYKDAIYLLGSKIPERKTVTFEMQSVVTGGLAQRRPMPVMTRAATSDFFPMFDVPFLYGSGWDAGADQNATPVAVLSREQNEKLFGGANSVGRTIRWNDHEVRIVGVLDAWFPKPRFYDLNDDPFAAPDDMYIPLSWAVALEQTASGGNSNCWKPEVINTYQDYLASDCVWTQMWVELPDAASRERMQGVMDAYWAEQRKAGRFPKPRDNRLTRVDQWLKDQGVVPNDN